MRIFALSILITCFSLPAISSASEMSDQPVCRVLAEHTPRNDVAYKPGVDVHGNKVVPADISPNAGYGFAAQPVRIPLQIDILEQYQNVDLDQDLFDLEPQVGFIDVYPDGRVEINGQNVRNEFDVLCSSAKSTRPERIVEVSAEQQPSKPIVTKAEEEAAVEILEVLAIPPGEAEPLRPQIEKKNGARYNE